MALAGIELRFIVDHISGRLDGYYVNNIYGITKDSILFKLHHTTKDDLFLMISTFGIWLTATKLGQIEENRMQRRLRSSLLRMRLAGIRQVGAERIAYLTFEGFGSELVLVVEMFGDGNIILCGGSGDTMKILALMRSVDVRHRTLRVGAPYVPPPTATPTASLAAGGGSSGSSGGDSGPVDVLHLSRGDFAGLPAAEMPVARWLGRTLGLPKKYAEGIPRMAGVPPSVAGTQLGAPEVDAIFQAATKLVSDVTSGNHTPCIIRGDAPDVMPIMIRDGSRDGGHDAAATAAATAAAAAEMEEVPSFMEGLDRLFTESLLGRARDAGASRSAAKIRDLQTQIAEQQKAVDTVMRRSESVSTLARSLLALATSQGVLSMSDARAVPTLEECGAVLFQEKGAHMVRIHDKKIQVDMQAPLQSVASSLFDEAKRQARAAPAIQRSMSDARGRLEKLQDAASLARELAGEIASEIRKKSWFERYRWFYTSDGSLAVGGRDAASNSAVIRKQMSRNDRVFHAEVHGSPFFLLKNAVSPSDVSMNEVAHATVCFSRAWREGMHGMSAFWVRPDQVKKSAPSGQFLPKGSFTISGQRNFVRAQTLRMAVGLVPHNGGHVVVCGPTDPVVSRSVLYAIIEPYGSDLAEAAKRIRTEFLNMNEDVTKTVPLDDFVRALPSGKSQVKEVGQQKREEDVQDAEATAEAAGSDAP